MPDDHIRKAEEDFERLNAFIPPAEAVKVETLRRNNEAGNKFNSYGHDLLAAVKRGYRNRAIAQVREAMESMGEAGWNWHGERRARGRFAGALTALICAGAQEGVTAEEIREILQRTLNADDSTCIEKTVERNSA